MAETPKPKTLDDAELARYVIQRHEQLKGRRASWDTWWQEVAVYCMTRKAEIMSSRSEPSSQRDDVLFDGTMCQANVVLANGCMSYLTPADARWFSYDPPAFLRGVDPVEQYFRQCTEIASMELARSNFYTEVHELYMDRGCFGTGVLNCEEGRRNLLHFRKFDVGSFSLAEDDEGYVDTLSREFILTTRQAVQWFSYENCSEVIQKHFDSGDPVQLEKEHTFLHQVFPRQADMIDFGKKDRKNMPIASVYVEQDQKLVVRNAGYTEQPFFATRYLKWMSEHAYGWSPAWMALSEARQLNFLQKQLDALAELAAFPRFLVPDTHEGDVDYRASGVTYFDPANPAAIPREWATTGRYDYGKDRAEMKQKAINDAFHVDLFKLFANLDRPQMTAREVAERASEKLIQFSPTFARMTTELYTPLLTRVWGICARAGAFPPPPQELIVQTAGGAALAPPQLTYSSKIALAIKGLENSSFMNAAEMWSPLAAQKPEVFDNLDWDACFRDTVRNGGLPARWLIEVDQRDQIRQARQQQMEEQQKQQQMMMAAEGASKLGAVKNDSVIGQQVASQLNGTRQ